VKETFLPAVERTRG